MDPKFYKEYYYLERNHWWFTARIKILESQVAKIAATYENKSLRILNAGVATGATSEMLKKFGEVVSLEYDKECCTFLTDKTDIKPVHGSLIDLPFSDKSFDLVCALDVIEHIENDVLACREIARVLKPMGTYMITVPAFKFLWSNHDIINHHFRRYTSQTLKKILRSANLDSVFFTYFNFLLFLPIATFRILQRVSPKTGRKESSGSDNELFQSNKFINRVLYRLFFSEDIWLRKGKSFPFGISLLAIGKTK